MSNKVKMFPVNFRHVVQPRVWSVFEKAEDVLRERLIQCFIAFISIQEPKWQPNTLDVPVQFWFGRERGSLLNLSVEEGMCGWSIKDNQLKVYPNMPESLKHFRQGSIGLTEKEKRGEVVSPLYFQGKTTAVVVFDGSSKFEQEKIDVIRTYVEEIREIFDDFSNYEEKIQAAANTVLDGTNSKRGYIAIKSWIGNLDYFKTGDSTDVFLPLSASDGLCGQAFATCELQNVPDVWKEVDYIPSDPKINSEIVCPILVNGQAVGIINMESEKKSAYTKLHEKQISQLSKRLAEDEAIIHSTIPHFDLRPSWELTISLLNILNSESSAGIRGRLVNEFVKFALNRKVGVDLGFWQLGKSVPEFIDSNMSIEEIRSAKTLEIRGDIVILEPIYAAGVCEGVVWCRSEEAEFNSESSYMLKSLCLVLGFSLHACAKQIRQETFHEILEVLLNEKSDEYALYEMVQLIPTMMDSEHCTLFFRFNMGGETRFIAGPSTGNLIAENYNKAKTWYGKGVGLTSYVVKKAKPLVVNNVEDQKELGDIDQGLVWTGGVVSEDNDSFCRSFIAQPIFDKASHEFNRSDKELIGILRTHRDRRSKRSAFTSSEVENLQTIADVASQRIAKYLAQLPC